MKRLAIATIVAFCLAFVGCNKDNIVNLTKVSVHVNDFSISQEEFPTKSAEDPATYSGVQAMTLAFYAADGTEIYKLTQLKSDNTTYTTFGEFDLTLPMGSYTMVVLGYGLKDGEPAITLTSPSSATFGTNPARETFAATQAVNIANTNDVSLSATLNRIISKLQIASTDVRTAGANNVRMTFSAGSKSFSPVTGLATDNSGFNSTVTTSTAVGVVSLSNSYLFLASDEQTMDVTIDVLDDDDNVLTHKVVTNVPFKRNRVTKLTGSLYSADVNGSFLVETGWETQYDGTF